MTKLTTRRTKMTGKRQAAFLRLIAAGTTITAAANVIGVSRTAVYECRAEDERFATAWDNAIESRIELLEAEAMKRAMNGSDRLLEFLLKAARPGVYRERVDIGAHITGRVTLEQLVGAAMRPIELDDASGQQLPALPVLSYENDATRDAWSRFKSTLPPDASEGSSR